MKNQYAVQLSVGMMPCGGYEEGVDCFTIRNLSIGDAVNELNHIVDCITNGITMPLPNSKAEDDEWLEILHDDCCWVGLYDCTNESECQEPELIAGGSNPDGFMGFGTGFDDDGGRIKTTAKSMKKFIEFANTPGMTNELLALEIASRNFDRKFRAMFGLSPSKV